MGRPRKPDGEKLVAVTTNLQPSLHAALCRLALARRQDLSVLIRELLSARLETSKTQIRPTASTL